jgi:hypothetical protein
MILPIIIIVLILSCAYLEYQKNINMNNKLMICIICILTLTVCLCFIDKYKNTYQGFENHNNSNSINNNTNDYCGDNLKCIRAYDVTSKPNSIETFENKNENENEEEEDEKHLFDDDDMREKCGKDSSLFKETSVYNDTLKNIKSDEESLDILNKFIAKLESKDADGNPVNDVCWQLPNYIECKALRNKVANRLKLDKDEQKDLDGICTNEILETCIEETLIKENPDNPNFEKVLNNTVKMRTNDQIYLKREQIKDLILKIKNNICLDCGLKNETCKKTKEDLDNRVKEKAENKKNSNHKESEELKEKIKEQEAELQRQIEAQAQLNKQQEQQQQLLLLRQQQLQLQNQNKKLALQQQLSQQDVSSLYNNANINPNSFPIIQSGQQSGHQTDKYYTSLNNKPPGYSYIDPKLWTVPQKRAPLCHHVNELNATPLYDRGTPINVLELTPYGDQAVVEREVSLTNIGSILPKFSYNEVH